VEAAVEATQHHRAAMAATVEDIQLLHVQVAAHPEAVVLQVHHAAVLHQVPPRVPPHQATGDSF